MQAPHVSRPLLFPFQHLSLPMGNQFLVRQRLRAFDGYFTLVLSHLSLPCRYQHINVFIPAHTYTPLVYHLPRSVYITSSRVFNICLF